MCYEYRRFQKQAEDEERARKAADTAIEKAKASQPKEPEPKERPVHATEPATN